jgi:hypothetical protein
MKHTKIIALGTCCQITWDLEKYGLRDESSVFEWYDSPLFKDILKIMKIIGNQEKIAITTREPEYPPDNLFLEDTRIKTGHYTIDELPAILERRALRFVQFIRSEQPILFVRHERNNVTLDDVEEFKRIVESINPSCNYNLLLCIEPDSYKPIICPRIYCRSKPAGSWVHLIHEACPGEYPNESFVKAHDKD